MCRTIEPSLNGNIGDNQGHLDRRQFIAITVVAAATIGSFVQAAEPENANARPIQWKDEGIRYVDPDCLIVALMGDPQIHMNPRSPEYAQTAMSDLEIVPHDFLVVLGDLVQNNPKFYDDYETIILKEAKRPVFSVAGNADLNCGLDEYKRRTGMPLWFAIHRRGIRFIFLSVTKVTGPKTHICCLGSEQLEWLRTELAKDKNATTIIFFHAPVFETTWHSEDRESLPFPGSMYLQESKQMRDLFSLYPNIKVYAHGHLHHTYGVEDELGRSEYCLEDGVLHVSVGATAGNRGSSFLFVEKERIFLRVRDHGQAKWKDHFEYILKAETTLADM